MERVPRFRLVQLVYYVGVLVLFGTAMLSLDHVINTMATNSSIPLPGFSQSASPQKSRRDQVTNACRQSESKVKGRGQWSVIYADDKRKLLYCLPSKAGSTTWKRAWGLLSGTFTPRKIQQAMKALNVTENVLVHAENYARLSGIRRISNKKAISRENSYYKVIVVRNPYQRLLSAYFGMIQENSPYVLPVSYQIADRYGKRNGSRRGATFEEFIEHVLFEYSASGTRGINDHWAPIHVLCRPCELTYDYVIKLEHHHEEASVLIKNVFNTSFSMDDVFKQEAGPHSMSREHDIRTFYTIERHKLDRLQKYLEFDCRLFGYDCRELFHRH